jgi:hypothetical protein
MTLPNRNNGTKTHKLLLTNMYEELMAEPIDIDAFKKAHTEYKEEYLEEYFKIFDKNIYDEIISGQYVNATHWRDKFNMLLMQYKSPYLFHQVPRTGYGSIFENIEKYNLVVTGFSLFDKDRETEYAKPDRFEAGCHSKNDEYRIIKWLHENDKIDATLCLLKDEIEPTLDGYLIPKPLSVKSIIKIYKYCILENKNIDKSDYLEYNIKEYDNKYIIYDKDFDLKKINNNEKNN